jgi:hypothetical protein
MPVSRTRKRARPAPRPAHRPTLPRGAEAIVSGLTTSHLEALLASTAEVETMLTTGAPIRDLEEIHLLYRVATLALLTAYSSLKDLPDPREIHKTGAS